MWDTERTLTFVGAAIFLVYLYVTNYCGHVINKYPPESFKGVNLQQMCPNNKVVFVILDALKSIHIVSLTREILVIFNLNEYLSREKSNQHVFGSNLARGLVQRQ